MPDAGTGAFVGARRGLTLVAVVAAVLGASAIALTPVRDHGYACGSPIVAAVHGRSGEVVANPLYLVWPYEVRGAPGAEPPTVPTTVCRDLARDRLLAASGVMVLLLALAVRWQVLDPRRRYPVDTSWPTFVAHTQEMSTRRRTGYASLR